MSGVKKRKAIETKYGKPLPEILIELYPKLGSQKKIAEHLGVTQSTVSHWLTRFRLQEKTQLVQETAVVE